MATKKSIRAGIIGAAGYTGGELLRLLIHHPHVSVSFANSRSQAGKPVAAVHQDLAGDTNLNFTDGTGDWDVDVVFLCVGHGEAKKFLTDNPVPAKTRVI